MEAPESKWPYIATYLEANLYAFRWNHYKERKRDKAEDADKGPKLLEEVAKGKKRTHEENKHSRKQDLSKMACLERPWNEQTCSSSAGASALTCISSIAWREVYSFIYVVRIMCSLYLNYNCSQKVCQRRTARLHHLSYY